jgi:hypothetical protein
MGKNIPFNQQMHKMATNYTKCPHNRPNGRKIDQPLSLQVPPKFTLILLFGLKICMPSGNPGLAPTESKVRLMLKFARLKSFC